MSDNDPDELERWIESYSHIVGVGFALRCCLRAIPCFGEWEPNTRLQKTSYESILLDCFRSLFLTFAHVDLADDFEELSNSIAEYTAKANRESFEVAERIRVSESALSVLQSCVSIANAIESMSTIQATEPVLNAIYHSVEGLNHALALEGRDLQLTSAMAQDRLVFSKIEDWGDFEDAFKSKLWQSGTPVWATKNWNKIRQILLSRHSSFSVWTSWYEGRVRGQKSSWDTTWEVDEKISMNIVMEGHEFWDQEPREINATILEWINDAKLHDKNNLDDNQDKIIQSPEAWRGIGNNLQIDQETLVKNASPEVRELDLKLDAVPNAKFDTPEFSLELESVPPTLTALTKTLLEALPRNAPPIVRSSLESYKSHVSEYGFGPILGIIKPLGSAIVTEYKIDVGVWSEGTMDIFRGFEDAHKKYLEHFPRDEERKKYFNSIQIEDIDALYADLDVRLPSIMEAIEGLKQEQRTTPEFDNAMAIVWPLGRDLANVPPPTNGQPSSEKAEARKHWILNAVGIAGKTVTVLAAFTAIGDSLAAAKLYKQLGGWLEKAMEHFS